MTAWDSATPALIVGAWFFATVQGGVMAAEAWQQRNDGCEPETLTIDRGANTVRFTVGSCPLDYTRYGLTAGGDPSCRLGPLEWDPGTANRMVNVLGQPGAVCTVAVAVDGTPLGSWEFAVGGGA